MALPPLTLVLLPAFIFYLIYKFIVYPAFVSPLSKIPNAHWSAPYSEAWIVYRRYRNRNNRTVYAAHQRYGPIVRLAPNELSVNCVDGGIRTIYAGGFEKHDWYPRLFPSYGVLNSFSTVGHGPHSAKKRMVSNVYSKSFLASSAQIAANSKVLLGQRFLPLIQRYAETGESVDVHEMNNAFAMDFMSAYQFGIANSTNYTHDVALRRRHLHQYHIRKDYEFYSQEVPTLKRLSAWLGRPLVPREIDAANDELEKWGITMCDGADNYLGDLSADRAGEEPVVYKQFKAGMGKFNDKNATAGDVSATTRASARLEVASEMLDHLGAGHETSAIALTYLLWEMSQRPNLQAQLHRELRRALDPVISWPPASASSPLALPPPKTIDALPLLHAVVMETLRLHAPIPGHEPRITPSTPGGCTLVGYSGIPGNVRVSAMPYCLHRNPAVFPEPEAWKPERWLQQQPQSSIKAATDDPAALLPADSEQAKAMARWFWAFGSGGRMCVGSNLALQEIKLVVAAVYSNWRTEIVDDDGIEELDAYTTKPARNRLDLKFLPVPVSAEGVGA